MCGRFSQSESTRRLAEMFGADADPDLPAGSYNVAPTDPIRILIEADGRRRLVGARWDFRPFWASTAGGAGTRPRTGPWINARAETSFDSPAFGPAIRRRRCIVPTDAFYEWDRAGSVRQPYAIGAAGAGTPLALAGIWSPAAERDDPPGAAVLTTMPNGLIERVHDRMPVILIGEAIDAWLAPETDPAALLALVQPVDSDALHMWPVSTAVNGVHADGPALLQPVVPAPDLGLV